MAGFFDFDIGKQKDLVAIVGFAGHNGTSRTIGQSAIISRSHPVLAPPSCQPRSLRPRQALPYFGGKDQGQRCLKPNEKGLGGFCDRGQSPHKDDRSVVGVPPALQQTHRRMIRALGRGWAQLGLQHNCRKDFSQAERCSPLSESSQAQFGSSTPWLVISHSAFLSRADLWRYGLRLGRGGP